nr:hypothetical protein [uncultured Dongia sp.]
MLDVDPHADRTSTIAYRMQREGEEAPGSRKLLGEDRRFSLRWANTNHNALGNYLHAPTLFQIENNQAPSQEKILQKARDVAEVIRHTLAGPIINANFGSFYKFACQCGSQIKRRDGSFKLEDGIKCPTCSAVWDVTTNEENSKFEARLRKTSFECHVCHASNEIGAHEIRLGNNLTCACGARFTIVFGLNDAPTD